MGDEQDAGTLRERLERFGDAHRTARWTTGDVDYVGELSLTSEDVPELVRVARKWAEPIDWPDDESDISVYAPIHAWRALGQLGAPESVHVLLGMMDLLDAVGDDWYLEEFPHVFAWIGPVAMPAVRAYLADAEHEMFPRAAAAHALQAIADRHPQARDESVRELRAALAPFKDSDPTLNAFLISYLLDMKAIEAAEVIERAYAADRVDLTVCGNWNYVREALGVEGLGLVPAHLAARRPFRAGMCEAGELADPARPVGDAPAVAGPEGKIGRNEPCPCGSGRKYKKCCGDRRGGR